MPKGFQQIEKEIDYNAVTNWGDKPWGKVKRSRKWKKERLHRCERHRANINPECEPLYKRLTGFEW